MTNKSFWACLAVIVFLVTSARANENDSSDQLLNKCQGTWVQVKEDEDGVFRIVKVVDGNQEMVCYFRNDTLVRIHQVEFEVKSTPQLNVFTFRNGVVLAGPDKGQKFAGPFSYALKIENNTWHEVFGLLSGSNGAPTINRYHKLLPPKNASVALKPDNRATLPWGVMLGHWEINRSDGTSSKVFWSRPAPDVDIILGDWEDGDGTKSTELAVWHPTKQSLVIYLFRTDSQGDLLWFDKVSPKAMSGWIQVRDADGKTKVSSFEIQRVSETLSQVKAVDEADGSIVTHSVTARPKQ